MKYRREIVLLRALPLALLLPLAGAAQVPVNDDGDIVTLDGTVGYELVNPDTVSTDLVTGNEGIPLQGRHELEQLVGPIALYPDDLLAVVLPAATYPLQVVQAARFLEDLETNPGLEPDPDWDDSIIALINYPDVVALLNEDLDWTWRLGEAVVAQQEDVLGAVEGFRNRAYVAGNLKSDEYQTVAQSDGIIEITPVSDHIIYVPYYEPERVVRYQTRPVYHYYARPYPVYYYPYPASYAFDRGYFWGVTTAFAIGWNSNHLHVFHHSYRGHPYFGARYRDRWWYRRPSISVHNTVYVNNNVRVSRSRLVDGDTWRPRRGTRIGGSNQRITRNVYNPNRRRSSNPPGFVGDSFVGDSTVRTNRTRTPSLGTQRARRDGTNRVDESRKPRAPAVRNRDSRDATDRAGSVRTRPSDPRPSADSNRVVKPSRPTTDRRNRPALAYQGNERQRTATGTTPRTARRPQAENRQSRDVSRRSTPAQRPASPERRTAPVAGGARNRPSAEPAPRRAEPSRERRSTPAAKSPEKPRVERSRNKSADPDTRRRQKR